MDIPSISPELQSAFVRQQVLIRLREYYEQGYRDPEMLYLGARYAIAQGLPSEARLYLEPLASMLIPDGQPAQAYFPVGLLNLLILPDDAGQSKARQEILQRLSSLVKQSPTSNQLYSQLVAEGIIDQPTIPPASSAPATGSNPSNAAALVKDAARLAQQADQAYYAKDLPTARHSLEKLLALDGDNPEVLRNLVTLTSEQRDIGAYERYWRRYVKVLLWRSLREDEALSARDDLAAFYLKAAMAMDSELAGQHKELVELLRRPGFLNRWLETHAGLVWMEAASTLGGGVSLREYWLRAFYPEFLPFAGPTQIPEPALHNKRIRTTLPYHPVQKLLTRFVEWAVFFFALQGKQGEDDARSELEINPHLEAVKALCGFVSRIPMTPYLQDLAETIDKIPEEQRSKRRTVRRYIQDACSIGYQSFGHYLEQEDFQGMSNYLSEPAKLGNLSPYLALFLGLAKCKLHQEDEAVMIAFNSVPDLQEEEVEKDAQCRQLLLNVLHAYMSRIFDPKQKSLSLSQIQKEEKIIKTWIQEIPDHNMDHLVQLKIALEEEVQKILDQIQLNKLIEQTIADSKKLVEAHKFTEARALIRQLPDQPDEVKELKKNLLDQIKEAEDGYNLNKKIESTIKAAKKAVNNGRFDEARSLVNALPSSHAELIKLKNNLISQIEEARRQHNEYATTKYRVEQVIEDAKSSVMRGDFSEAVRIVLMDMPDFEGKEELQRNLLEQINQAQRMSKRR